MNIYARSSGREVPRRRIYVGGLPSYVKCADLEELFAKFGRVANVDLVSERQSGRSMGFAFVEMELACDAQSAALALEGSDHFGRRIDVRRV